jgi:hypothetical protein
MKTVSAIDRAHLNLIAALRALAAVAGKFHHHAPSHDDLKRRSCEVDARGAWYHAMESRLSEMLVIAGTGILLYSAGVLFHPTHPVSFVATDTLPGLTTSNTAPANGGFSP